MQRQYFATKVCVPMVTEWITINYSVIVCWAEVNLLWEVHINLLYYYNVCIAYISFISHNSHLSH